MNRFKTQRHGIVAMLSILLVSGMAACSSKSKDNKQIMENRLYKESVAVTKVYLDSMNAATDSVTADRILENYDNAMTRVNYKYDPDLYLELRESENDELAGLTMKVVALHDSVLWRLAHPKAPLVLLPDSTVKADSIKTPARQK